MHEMKRPESKKQIAKCLDFSRFFRDYIPNFSAIAKPLTDLTGKRVPNRIPWGEPQEKAFQTLKSQQIAIWSQLCKATVVVFSIVDFKKPFTLHVDTSDHTVAAVLTQVADDGTERPVAFASNKLNKTQKNWSVIERIVCGHLGFKEIS